MQIVSAVQTVSALANGADPGEVVKSYVINYAAGQMGAGLGGAVFGANSSAANNESFGSQGSQNAMYLCDICDPVEQGQLPPETTAMDAARAGAALALNITPIGAARYSIAKIMMGRAGTTTAVGGTGVAATKLATHKHHLFPQAREFAGYFKKAGIDIHKYTVVLGRRAHLRGVHGKGINGLPGSYNQRWTQFFSNNPNATRAEIFKFMHTMRGEFSLSDLPIVPYK